MKETLNANIGSQAFILDQDAYQTLETYLSDIRSRLPENDTETISDIEARIAEIFREKLGASPMRVVTLELVREAMLQMGSPADFGEGPDTKSGQTPRTPDATPRKLYRSRSDRSIGGVCGGIATHFGIDPTLVRLVTLLLILFGGLSFWIYIILWIVIPEEPIRPFNINRKI